MPAAAHEEGEIAALLHLDARTYMVDDVLVKVDRTSMQHSLEVRVPLLDHRVVEFVARLPFGLKRKDGVTKWILRQTVKDLLPAETLARRKAGLRRAAGAMARRGIRRTRARGAARRTRTKSRLDEPVRSSGCSQLKTARAQPRETPVGARLPRAVGSGVRRPATRCLRRPRDRGWGAHLNLAILIGRFPPGPLGGAELQAERWASLLPIATGSRS